MAQVTITGALPAGIRLQDLFAAPITAITFSTVNGTTTATFRTALYSTTLQVTYTQVTSGSPLTETSGDVSRIVFGSPSSPWITLEGDYAGSLLVSYASGLKSFQSGGAVTAGLVLAGDDVITGSSKADYLEGFDGNDTLNGGAGQDMMVGGAGNDTYYVDNAADRIVEAEGGGIDVVWTSVSYVLSDTAEIERLQAAAGTAALKLTGSKYDNLIVGNAGNNTLDGGQGIDTLDGGLGNDTYFVDDPFDLVIEQAGGGTDLVLTNVSYSLADGMEIENLTASGGDEISLAGNDLDNTITGNAAKNLLEGMAGHDKLYGGDGDDTLDGGLGNDLLYGGRGADVFDGGDGADKLYGDVGNDTLDGGLGNDTLYAGTGSDSMGGGDGNDVLYGDAGNDYLSGGAGNDALYGGAGNNTLDGGEGDDTLYGSWNNERLYGGDGNDTLSGHTGNDTLDGGLGNDRIASGEGYDAIAFTTALDSETNVDRVVDFNPWADRFLLSRDAFTGFSKTGRLSSGAFWIGVKAHDTSDRIIYDKKSGTLYYDPDGTGSEAQIKFAVIGKIDLSAAAFWII